MKIVAILRAILTQSASRAIQKNVL